MARPSNYGPTIKKKAKYELERLLRYAYQNKLGRSEDGRIDIKSSRTILSSQKLKILRREMGHHVTSDMDTDIDDGDLWKKRLYPAISDYLSKFLGLIEDYTEESEKTQGKWNFYLNVEECVVEPQLWIDNILSRFEAEWDYAKERLKENNKSEGSNRKENTPKSNVEKLNGFLLNLNYKDQEREIEDVIDDLKGAGILLAEIDTEEMQRWMINRLITKNAVLKGARCTHRLASKLAQPRQETDFGGLFIEPSQASASDFVNHICKNMQEQRLSVYTIRKMELLPMGGLKELFSDFWMKLQHKINSDPSIKKSRCVFVLIGNTGWITKHIDFLTLDEIIARKSVPAKVKPNHRENLLVREVDEPLDDLEITTDLKNIVKSIIPLKNSWHPVSSKCINKWSDTYYGSERAGDFLSKLSRRRAGEWESLINLNSPHETIESICCNFLGEDSFIELSDSWIPMQKMKK